ncbi:uncharacterized protein (DUF58 family) [Dyadobacter sp. BE34]|uniref:Uncharacterized protein (DUF58 family) n=1 Tax=Dyadobacter fermentans TaxID=94254 RepID=A0ABU1R5G6_9BACT|nr:MULTISPECIES: DUF58 domain-containing protein [Dyadobacter]MDR6808633.1 uncharacterized protein (DUF58 family) [Dyadobacter fermentans]MDR7046376.1 uncharacterized protein (DUF58 family) [Dyadobacter sp. BE242]MDR7200689.1 uncharacterized protein (DUF58 family) [Dyadobacter sp. BE34]MDR7218649.1 uncharacterized protein (DUF58 family) [Dyadobacter sp. BE31]MDR7266579.1 uncharacterized protein (DUF58 family) [Dyadobacter sp. BE32]
MQKTTGLLASSLIKLKNLQLTGKLVSEELMLGIHSSKRSGIGIEFEQYRHYEPGDDPKRIDWKLFARTDKHLVRESSTESDRQIRFVLDLSGSMNYTENGVSRLQYAQILLASLAYLCYIQNDQMSLYGIADGRVETISGTGSAASARQAFQKILVGLEKVTAAGSWGTSGLRQSEFQSKKKEQLIFVSDLLQTNDEWLSWIRALAGPYREIVIFQILGDQEIAFDLKGFYRFKDLESGREMELDAEAVGTQFRTSMETYLADLKTALQIPHVRLVRARMSEPVGMVLKAFLTRRKG